MNYYFHMERKLAFKAIIKLSHRTFVNYTIAYAKYFYSPTKFGNKLKNHNLQTYVKYSYEI